MLENETVTINYRDLIMCGTLMAMINSSPMGLQYMDALMGKKINVEN